MKRYAIWNKKDKIITPVGEVFTPEQWIERYPVAGVDGISIVCAAGTVNGGYFGILDQMVDMYEGQGADFSACTTDEEKMEAINTFIEEREKAQAEAHAEAAANAAANEELTATSLASIAASMEYQNMMTLDDVEVE